MTEIAPFQVAAKEPHPIKNSTLEGIAKRARQATDGLIEKFSGENARRWGFDRNYENAKYLNKFYNSDLARRLFGANVAKLGAVDRALVGKWVHVPRGGIRLTGAGRVVRKGLGKLAVVVDVAGAISEAHQLDVVRKAARLDPGLGWSYHPLKGFYNVPLPLEMQGL